MVVGQRPEHEPNHIDASCPEDVFRDIDPLRPLVVRLLDNGTPFVTEAGTHDVSYRLCWTIEKSSPPPSDPDQRD